jgi:hypothetical protein
MSEKTNFLLFSSQQIPQIYCFQKNSQRKITIVRPAVVELIVDANCISTTHVLTLQTKMAVNFEVVWITH